MKTSRELKEELNRIHRKPYPAYKGLKGDYRFDNYVLTIDHVQGDPFAAPSRLHISLTGKESGIPKEYVKNEDRRIALADLCLRRFGDEIRHFSFQAKGSGKSGMIGVTTCGQQVLKRSSCVMGADGSVRIRFEVGFPANGRTINSAELSKIFFEFLPKIVEKSLVFRNMNERQVRETLELYEDQSALYALCRENHWAAFVADGSILPRKSGVSDKPMKEAKVFYAPESMRETIKLPHKGDITGMAIKEGITLIVGGGYHGKSTLLNGLETGIYHHIKGDGREYIASNETSFKVRAEDGRAISGTDISMFIRDLPNKKDTESFWTEDASGSTSQAANVAEAIRSGVELLLIDEDTSATNFMMRDDLMSKVIAKEKEPITPFLMRARELYEKNGISTILVAGSSGAYFSIADQVIQMDCYEALDITEKVRKICALEGITKITGKEDDLAAENSLFVKEDLKKKGKERNQQAGMELSQERFLGIKPLERKKGQLKTKQYSKESFSVGKETLELRGLEQLMDYEQTTTASYLLKYMLEQMERDKKKVSLEQQIEKTWNLYEEKGMEAICGTEHLPTSFAALRKQDFYGCVNRYRGFTR